MTSFANTMNPSIISGKISHSDHSVETRGYTTANQGGQVYAAHVWSFRLNNRPVIFKNRSPASFSDGDELTAAGIERNGTFEILACRNETTGAVYTQPSGLLKLAAIFLLVVGVPLLLIYVGVLFLALGVYLLRWGSRLAKANDLLLSTPRLQPA